MNINQANKRAKQLQRSQRSAEYPAPVVGFYHPPLIIPADQAGVVVWLPRKRAIA